jgi:hypothetical protein
LAIRRETERDEGAAEAPNEAEKSEARQATFREVIPHVEEAQHQGNGGHHQDVHQYKQKDSLRDL